MGTITMDIIGATVTSTRRQQKRSLEVGPGRIGAGMATAVTTITMDITGATVTSTRRQQKRSLEVRPVRIGAGMVGAMALTTAIMDIIVGTTTAELLSCNCKDMSQISRQ